MKLAAVLVMIYVALVGVSFVWPTPFLASVASIVGCCAVLATLGSE